MFHPWRLNTVWPSFGLHKIGTKAMTFPLNKNTCSNLKKKKTHDLLSPREHPQHWIASSAAFLMLAFLKNNKTWFCLFIFTTFLTELHLKEKPIQWYWQEDRNSSTMARIRSAIRNISKQCRSKSKLAYFYKCWTGIFPLFTLPFSWICHGLLSNIYSLYVLQK